MLIHQRFEMQNGASISFGKQTICILIDALGTNEFMFDHHGKLGRPVYFSPRM